MQARKARPFFFWVLQRITLVLVIKVNHRIFNGYSFSRGLCFWVLGLCFLDTRLTTDVAHEWSPVRSPSEFQRFCCPNFGSFACRCRNSVESHVLRL